MKEKIAAYPAAQLPSMFLLLVGALTPVAPCQWGRGGAAAAGGAKWLGGKGAGVGESQL
jgi:hypothetical protein